MAAASLSSFYQISIPIPYLQSLKTKPFAFHTSSHHLSLHIGTSLKPLSHKTLESRHDSPHLAPICVILPFFNSFSAFVRSCLRGGVAVGDHYGGDYVCSGSVGALLMSTSAAAVSKARASPFLWTLAGNPTFVSGLLAWALAQTMKVALHFFLERKLDMGILFSCGGMPSSHSALCMALTASVAFWHGVGDSLFPVCLGFSLIVMYDAIGVRRHAGMQAEVLNKIVEDLFQAHPLSKRKLKELLGHTPSQVLAGALLGFERSLERQPNNYLLLLWTGLLLEKLLRTAFGPSRGESGRAMSAGSTWMHWGPADVERPDSPPDESRCRT